MTLPVATVPGANYEEGDAGGMTVLIYGHPGTFKTTWAAQWPGVVFLSIASEGGDDALKLYPEIAKSLCERSQMKDCPPVFNTARPPRISIHSDVQLIEEVEKICLHHKEWHVCTVVVDSLSYLIDLWVDNFVERAEKNDPNWRRRVDKQGGELLGPKEWGYLNMYLRSLRVKLSNQGLNVIWTCIQRDYFKQVNQNEQVLEKSEPAITGQTKVKLPGMCKIHINAVREKIPHPTAMGRMIIQPKFYTAPDAYTDMRHKYWTKFPAGYLKDPEFDSLPTFRAMWAELYEYIYTG